jgi:hypothetical protein
MKVKGILEENYAMRRTLDYYACRMFSARQERGKSVASWGSRIDEMQTELWEAARRVCKPDKIQGAVGLIGHLGKACFVQGLQSERIQTIVRSRGESVLLSQAVEISLEEEGAILSLKEKPGAGGNTIRCTICNSLGHTASKCASKDRFPPANARAVMSVVSCYKCGRAGHLARYCRQGTTLDTRELGGSTEAALRIRAENCRQATTLGTREHGGSTEAACGVQGRSWTREGNVRQGPMCNRSRPQTRRM